MRLQGCLFCLKADSQRVLQSVIRAQPTGATAERQKRIPKARQRISGAQGKMGCQAPKVQCCNVSTA